MNRRDGEAYVFYRDTSQAKKKAERLAKIAAAREGFLNDKTPEEAMEIGKLLDYKVSDIKAYIKKRYK